MRTIPAAILVPAVAGILLLFAALSLWEMSGDSMTSDERVHLPAGYAYWTAREFRLNPEHPPLVKLLASAPLLFMDLRMPSVTPDPGQTFHQYQPHFGSRFFFSQDADRLLFWGRLPILALGLLLLLVLFFWSWELHGDPAAGLATLALAALEPTLLAHSHYVTTDVGVACFVLTALYFLWRYGRGGRRADLLVASIAMGLALASKFSAAVIAVFFLVHLLVRRPGARAGEPAVHRLAAAAGAACVMAIIVQGAYFFSPDFSLYMKGIRALGGNRPPFNPAYVHGRFFPAPVYWYPLYSWLLKTPLAALLAALLGGAACARDRRRSGREFPWIVVLPAALFFAVISLFSYNYGVRYLIPATALLLVLAGGSVRILARALPGRLAGLGLLLWLVASVGRSAPHFIAYFNEAAGGPANGPYVMNDSNLDWGQDLKRFAAYQREHGLAEPVLAYWGPTPPEHYGIRYRPWTRLAAGSADPPPGTYAVSLNNLVNQKRRVLMFGEDPKLDWLERFRPVDRAGSSILIFRFPEGR